MASKIIGLYYFENIKGQPQIMNEALYRTMFENLLDPVVVGNQGGGATAHTDTMILMTEFISKFK